MTDTVPLSVSARDAAKTAKALRRDDIVPCILYGNDTENVSIQCEYPAMRDAYRAAGKNTLVDLDVGGKKVSVLFHSVDFDSISGKITHVDFYAVDMKKEIEASVPVVFEGVAPAVKDLSGSLLTTLDHVTVRCLPTALPHELPLSIESLVDFEATLTVADLKVPAGVVVLDEADAMIATVQEPRQAEAPVEAEEGAAEGEGSAEGEGEAADAGGDAADAS